MASKQKYYAVWHGVTPGVYHSWGECQEQIKGFAGALYKSFDTLQAAEEALCNPPYDYINRSSGGGAKSSKKEVQNPPTYRNDTVLPLPPEVEAEALAVDAACSGNPGPMEYQGVYLRTGERVFHLGPMEGTNNIGEFLAIVHGLAFLKQKGYNMPIYTDSRNALLWIKQKKCKTKLPRNAKTEQVHQLIERAEKWLRENKYTIPLRKWETKTWGEIPADFGRK